MGVAQPACARLAHSFPYMKAVGDAGTSKGSKALVPKMPHMANRYIPFARKGAKGSWKHQIGSCVLLVVYWDCFQGREGQPKGLAALKCSSTMFTSLAWSRRVYSTVALPSRTSGRAAKRAGAHSVGRHLTPITRIVTLRV